MKYTFYIDFYAGINPAQFGLTAMTIPNKKIEGSKRIAFDVVIPDELINDIDGHAAEVTRGKLVGEEKQ